MVFAMYKLLSSIQLNYFQFYELCVFQLNKLFQTELYKSITLYFKINKIIF